MKKQLLDRKFWTLLGTSFLACLFIPFIGAPLLRVIRNVYGPKLFWLSGIALFAPLVISGGSLVGILIFSHWILIGLFAHFEEQGKGTFYYGLLSIFVATLATWQGPKLLQQITGREYEDSLQKNLEMLVNTLNNNPDQKGWFETMGITTESLLSQLPAILAILFLMGLGSALIFDRRIASFWGVRFERIVGTPRLLDFSIPNPFIWVFLSSLALSFLKVGDPATATIINSVALNVLHFMVGLYFFQGLAITETALLIFRVGPLMKSLFYILIVGQLFFLLSLVGLADYWLDLRQRLSRRNVRREL